MMASFTSSSPSSPHEGEQPPLQHPQREPSGQRAPVPPSRRREHSAYRLDHPIRQHVRRPNPPRAPEVAEPCSKHPYPNGHHKNPVPQTDPADKTPPGPPGGPAGPPEPHPHQPIPRGAGQPPAHRT